MPNRNKPHKAKKTKFSVRINHSMNQINVQLKQK